MLLIITIIIAIYFILLSWTWQSLGGIEKNKKIVYIITGTFAVFIITSIIFMIAKSGTNYDNIIVNKAIENVLVAIFTGINGIIILPQIGKILDKIHENEIEKAQAKKKFLIILILFVVCLVLEFVYMKDALNGILQTYNRLGSE